MSKKVTAPHGPLYVCEYCPDDSNCHPPDDLFLVGDVWLCELCADERLADMLVAEPPKFCELVALSMWLGSQP